MANNTEFRKRLIHSLAQVHSRAESDFKHLRRSLETNIKALVMQSEALKSKAEALESKTETLEMQNLSLELQIEKHVQEHRDLAQSHQQALIDLKARPNVEEENNQLFEQRLATLEKQLSATTRTESSDNAGGTTKLRTKRRCFELDRNPHNIDNPKTKRKYNNIGNDSLHGTFGMVLRSQTKNAK